MRNPRPALAGVLATFLLMNSCRMLGGSGDDALPDAPPGTADLDLEPPIRNVGPVSGVR